jgi:hypothetical protein
MNLNLREVVRTSRDGESFWSIQEMYIRGNTIKYLRVPDVIVDVVAEEKQARESSVRLSFGQSVVVRLSNASQCMMLTFCFLLRSV